MVYNGGKTKKLQTLHQAQLYIMYVQLWSGAQQMNIKHRKISNLRNLRSGSYYD